MPKSLQEGVVIEECWGIIGEVTHREDDEMMMGCDSWSWEFGESYGAITGDMSSLCGHCIA